MGICERYVQTAEAKSDSGGMAIGEIWQFMIWEPTDLCGLIEKGRHPPAFMVQNPVNSMLR
jgi:hypothetical protein